MAGLSRKKLVLLIVTILIALVFIGFAIYAIVIGKYVNAIALSSSTMLMLYAAFDYVL